MLKTNSKKVKEAIKNYIVENIDHDYIEEVTGKEVDKLTYSEIKAALRSIVFEEKEKLHCLRNRRGKYYFFQEWASGLPSALDTKYYYNISAVDLLGDILEETDEERNRFTEMQAEEMLTKLLFNEIYNGVL